MNGADTYTDWTLISLSPWPPWALWLAALCVALAVVAVIWQYRHTPQNALLISLRIIAAVLVLALLTEPALQLRVVRRVPDRVAVIVDRSASMALASGTDQPSRMAQVQQFLRSSQPALEKLATDHVLTWHDLDGPITPAQWQAKPEGQHSDLLQALAHVKGLADGKPLAGIVFISDGATTGDDVITSTQAHTQLKNLGVPVNTFDVTSNATYRDVRIAEVLADEFAFVHNTMRIDVTVRANGFHNVRLPVTLKREGVVITTQDVLLSDNVDHHVAFQLKPDSTGDMIYSVHIPVLQGEAITANNEHTLMVRVIRDKIRVLQVAGHPSWDERFLRQHLKDNPNVDLISFFILRTPEDQPGPEKELSLIPFPVDELFTTQLASFDVLILQDFDYRPYHMAQYLPNIRDAVQGGLGFVMMGGHHSLGAGGYANTPIASILPVQLRDGPMQITTYQPTPTAAGLRHPITDLTPRGSVQSNAHVWSRLPKWEGINPIAGLVPGATALVHADNSHTPIIAVMDAGAGRSMTIATPSIWRWRFTQDRQGGLAERAYPRFWSNALRWLVRDPEHARIRVQPAQRIFHDADPVRVTFAILGDDYQPVPNAPLQITLERIDEGNTTVQSHVLHTDAQGSMIHTYDTLPPGAYRITAARDSDSDVSPGRVHGSATFLRQATSIEQQYSTPRSDILKYIAEHTGGHFSALTPAGWDDVIVHDPDVVDIDRRKNIALWDNAIALLLITAVLIAEWFTRRQRGYL